MGLGGKGWVRVGLLFVGLSAGCRQGDVPSALVPTPQAPAEPGPEAPRSEAPIPPSEPDTKPEAPAPEAPPPASPSPPRRPWLRASFYAGVSPAGLGVGDFDGDGALDVLVNLTGRDTETEDWRKGTLRLLRNDGRGQLTASASSRPLLGARDHMLVADVNGDGRLDALASTYRGAEVLFGQGDGSFIPGKSLLCPGATTSLGLWTDRTGALRFWAVGLGFHWEWQGPTLCQARFPEGTRVEEWDATGGSWYELRPYRGGTVADFNEDGLPDVLLSQAEPLSSEEAARLLPGEDSGRFTAGPLLSELPAFERVHGADFNQDGHMDVLGSASSTGTLSLYLGTGRGDFLPSDTHIPGTSMAFVVDLDGDAFPDVVVAHHPTAEVSLWRGSREGVLLPWGRLAVGRGLSDVAVADLKGDGTRELLVAEASDNTVSVYTLPSRPVTEPPQPFTCFLNTLTPGTEPRPTVMPLATIESVDVRVPGAVGDFDGDGREDLALALGERAIHLVLHAENNRLSPQVLEATRGRRVTSFVAGDFDGDGRDELAGEFMSKDRPDTDYLYDQLVLWNEADGAFTTQVVGESWWWGRKLLPVDFDGDGRMDLAFTHPWGNRGEAGRLMSRGGRGFRVEPLEDFDFTWGSRTPHFRMVAADFNGDGTLDVVHETNGLNLNYTAADGSPLPGGQGFAHWVGEAADSFFGTADVDGDGTPDLISQATAKGQVEVLRGDGHGTLEAPMTCALPAGERLLAWEDVNGDGTADVVSTTDNGRRLWVVPRTKTGQWGTPRLHALDSPAQWVRRVDLVGDARPELAVMLQSGRLLVFPTP